MDQQKRQRCEPLLAIDDEPLPVFLRHDDGAKEVLPILGHGPAFVMGLVVLEKARREILNQFSDLLRLPLVVTLIVVDPELLPEQGSDRSVFAANFLHKTMNP